MGPFGLIRRSLLFHWRGHLAVALGAASATAALTGALLVGDSMRGSLRENSLRRLAAIDHAMIAQRYVRESLAGELQSDSRFKSSFTFAYPLVLLRTGVVHADSRLRAAEVNAFGIDGGLARLAREASQFPIPDGRSVVINDQLATELGAAVGDDLLLRLGKHNDASLETLMGRRDDTVASLRVTVQAVVADSGLGALNLSPSQQAPLNLFVDRKLLQDAVGQPGRVNSIVVVAQQGSGHAAPWEAELLQTLLDEHLTYEDANLVIRANEELGYVSLETTAMLLEPTVEQAARIAFSAIGYPSSDIVTYLATAMRKRQDGEIGDSIPYSVVSAIAPDSVVAAQLAHGQDWRLAPGEIWLNQWAADDLHAKVGEAIELEYDVVAPFGSLESRSASFTLSAILPMHVHVTDAGFAPEYPGITDSNSLSDWDPPFPIDFSTIRDKDERYWDQYKTAPKAFITMEDGLALWSADAERFGRLTAIRFDTGTQSGDARMRIAASIDQALRADKLGLSFQPLRHQLRATSEGTTDFGGLFIGFSFFLISSAATLCALFFRLSAERRSSEVGTLLALGFTPRQTIGYLLAEGCVVASAGSVFGLLLAVLYGNAMLLGLRTLWAAAANAPFLSLHLSVPTLIAGFAISVLIALGSMCWSLRGLSRQQVRTLLAGGSSGGRQTARASRRLSTVLGAIAIVVGLLLAFKARSDNAATQAVGFFGSGAALLVATLALAHRFLRGGDSGTLVQRTALVSLAWRNTRRNPGRSMLTISLIASATFLISSMQAFRVEPPADTDRAGSLGGFALLAESGLPLPFDLSSSGGRDQLGFADAENPLFTGAGVYSFRLRPGDDASCQNLYKPGTPRIIGASDAFIARGGFEFSQMVPQPEGGVSSPWALLNKRLEDGAIPVIGDEAVVKWQLHLGLGEDMLVTDEQGVERKLRFVALLKGSCLQSELIVAQRDFQSLFPSIDGHAFFLIETEEPDAMTSELEEQLERFALNVESTAKRLQGFLSVQNTYLVTFQVIGGLGLVLGTVGLLAVMLRNIWQRRSELALMRTVGFSPQAIGALVFLENAALVLGGILGGLVPAAVAVAPTCGIGRRVFFGGP